MVEIIPKVVLSVDQRTLACSFACPGCGQANAVYLFSEDAKSANKEARSIGSVQCDRCCARFDTK